MVKPKLLRQDAVVGGDGIGPVPRPKNSTIRRYVFTLNNPPKDLAGLKDWLSDEKYACFGEEIAPGTGTPHLQGFVRLSKPTRFLTIKKDWADRGLKPYIAHANGSTKQCREYSKKDGVFWESGMVGAPGQRNDMASYLKDACVMSDWELSEAHPNLWGRCRKAGEAKRALFKSRAGLAYLAQEFQSEDWEFNDLQDDWWIALYNQNKREVLWISDPIGGAGKTTFASWLIYKHKAFYVRNGKNADIACAFEKAEPSEYVVIDLARCQQERMNYGTIEAFKDGKIFAPKYDSKQLFFESKKVIVLANFMPDMDKLSHDRWNIIEVSRPVVGHAGLGGRHVFLDDDFKMN